MIMVPLRQTANSSAGGDGLVVSSRIAAVAWVFMLIWMAMLVAFTWITARDGSHLFHPPSLLKAALAVAWLVGLPVAAYALSVPCTRLRVAADGSAMFSRRTLFGRAEEQFPAGSIASVAVRTGRDSDGDPHFRTVLIAAGGRETMVKEGPAEAEQQALAVLLRAALGLPGTEPPGQSPAQTPLSTAG